MFARTQWREMCKFFSGAFFSSTLIFLYLCLASVSVPISGTYIVVTPQGMFGRSIMHGVLFLVFFYLGFFGKGKSCSAS